MFFLYSLLLTVGFIVLLPRFLFDAIFKGKYAAGFKQRLGFLPEFNSDGRKVVWIHCVSVGEANAARPLTQAIKKEFPDSRLIISTTTKTGQELAQQIFAGVADLIFYYPFDWRFSVRRTLGRFSPAVVLMMETEIWFNFIRQANKSGSHVCLVNGRLSERSYRRFLYIDKFMHRVLAHVDLALMQDKADAQRIMALGLRASRVRVTGNLKFDIEFDRTETKLTRELSDRFGIVPGGTLIIAASTHSPEEKLVVNAFVELSKSYCAKPPRLMIAPRHPERFEEVADVLKKAGFEFARRSEPPNYRDRAAEIILLDSIGELRSAYPLAEVVFVGGSLIPHGGQSVFEPAAAGTAIVTGPHTSNFAAAVKELSARHAIVQLPTMSDDEFVRSLADSFRELLSDDAQRRSLGKNALAVVEDNRGAVAKTIEYLMPLLRSGDNR